MAARFNHQFKTNYFPLPRAVLGKAKRVMSLRDPLRKMSKSDAEDGSRINITDSPELIRSKISKAVTDSTRGITYDPEGRPGLANLVEILSIVTDRTPEETAATAADWNNAQLKKELTDNLVEHLRPIRERFVAIQNEPAYVVDVLRDGQMRANELAEATMRDVRRIVGFSA